jgi:hypothetical protein
MRKHLAATFALVGLLVLVVSTSASAISTRSEGFYFLSTGDSFQINSDSAHRNAGYTFTLETGSSREVLVRDIGRSGPGLQLQKPTTLRQTRVIPPHESISITLHYHVSSCAKVPKGDWPLELEVAWKSGKWYRVKVQMLNAGLSLQWQKSIANGVCPR